MADSRRLLPKDASEIETVAENHLRKQVIRGARHAHTQPKIDFTPGPWKDLSNVGLNERYHGPSCLSIMGRISHVQVSAEYRRLCQPISFERLMPTGQCQLGGTRTLGRMWLPT